MYFDRQRKHIIKDQSIQLSFFWTALHKGHFFELFNHYFMQGGWKVWLHCSYSTNSDRFTSCKQIEHSVSLKFIFSSKVYSISRSVNPTLNSGCLNLHQITSTFGFRISFQDFHWSLLWLLFRFDSLLPLGARVF